MKTSHLTFAVFLAGALGIGVRYWTSDSLEKSEATRTDAIDRSSDNLDATGNTLLNSLGEKPRLGSQGANSKESSVYTQSATRPHPALKKMPGDQPSLDGSENTSDWRVDPNTDSGDFSGQATGSQKAMDSGSAAFSDDHMQYQQGSNSKVMQQTGGHPPAGFSHAAPDSHEIARLHQESLQSDRPQFEASVDGLPSQTNIRAPRESWQDSTQKMKLRSPDSSELGRLDAIEFQKPTLEAFPDAATPKNPVLSAKEKMKREQKELMKIKKQIGMPQNEKAIKKDLYDPWANEYIQVLEAEKKQVEKIAREALQARIAEEKAKKAALKGAQEKR